MVLGDPRFYQKSTSLFQKDLLVKVERYKQIRVDYFDFNKKQIILTDDLSELIQHEHDHLDGILATQRVIDDKSFRWKK